MNPSFLAASPIESDLASRAHAWFAARGIAWIALATAIGAAGLGFVFYGVYLEGAALGRPSIGAFLAGGVALIIAALISRAMPWLRADFCEWRCLNPRNHRLGLLPRMPSRFASNAQRGGHVGRAVV